MIICLCTHQPNIFCAHLCQRTSRVCGDSEFLTRFLTLTPRCSARRHEAGVLVQINLHIVSSCSALTPDIHFHDPPDKPGGDLHLRAHLYGSVCVHYAPLVIYSSLSYNLSPVSCCEQNAEMKKKKSGAASTPRCLPAVRAMAYILAWGKEKKEEEEERSLCSRL